MKLFYIVLMSLFVNDGFTNTLYAQPQRDNSPYKAHIAALVNDSPITQGDLNLRLNLAMALAGLPDNAENRKFVRAQLLNAMIEEKLQLAEAKQAGLLPSKEEITKAFEGLSPRGDISPQEFKALLLKLHIPTEVVKNQLEANLAWNRYIEARFDSANISEREIEDFSKKASTQSPEHEQVSEIFLPIHTPSEENKTWQEAGQAMRKIRQGISFSLVAQEFSKAASAAKGGNVGHLPKGSLDPSLEAVIQALKPGEVSLPVKGPAGIYIFQKHFTEKLVYDLMQILLPTQNEEEMGVAAAYIHDLKQRVSSCPTAETKLHQELPTAKITKAREAPLHSLPPQLAELLKNQKPGELTEPIGTPQGVLSFIVCGVKERKYTPPTRQEAQQALLHEKRSLLAQRILRDLRRNASIEIKDTELAGILK